MVTHIRDGGHEFEPGFQCYQVRIGKVAGEADLEYCRRLVDQLGLEHAATKIGLSRQTLASILAKLPVQAGTLAIVQQRRGER